MSCHAVPQANPLRDATSRLAAPCRAVDPPRARSVPRNPVSPLRPPVAVIVLVAIVRVLAVVAADEDRFFSRVAGRREKNPRPAAGTSKRVAPSDTPPWAFADRVASVAIFVTSLAISQLGFIRAHFKSVSNFADDL